MKLCWTAILVWALCPRSGSALLDSEYVCRNEAVNAASQILRQGEFANAAKVYSAVLEETKRSQEEPLCTAALLSNLGIASHGLGRRQDAENYFKRALATLRSAVSRDDTLLLRTMNNLAAHYIDRRQFARAERLGLRSMEARLDSLRITAGDAANLLTVLGSLDASQKRYTSAEGYYRKAFAISEKLGSHRIETMQILNNMGGLYRRAGRAADARSCYTRAMAIAEMELPPEDPKWIPLLANASGLQDPPLAEQHCRRALAIAEKSLGPDHRLTGEVLAKYAEALRRMNRKAEAKRYEKRAKSIFSLVSGDDLGRFSVDAADLAR